MRPTPLEEMHAGSTHEELVLAQFCPPKQQGYYATELPHMMEGTSQEQYWCVKQEHTRSVTQKRKQVRFSDAPPRFIDDLIKTEQDITKSWLSRQDYDLIRQQNKHTVACVRRGFFDHSNECLRGLETLLSATSYGLRKQRTIASVSTIVTEQRMQKDTGVRDPLAIRTLSLMLSKMAAGEARARAARDASVLRVAVLQDKRKRAVVDEREAVPSEKVSRRRTVPLPTQTEPCSAIHVVC